MPKIAHIMINIHFLNRKITLITELVNQNENNQISTNSIIYYYELKDNNIADTIDNFYTNIQIKHLVIVCPAIDELFYQITECFKCIQAAGGLVKNDKGEYLLIFRNNQWDLPKGKRE